MSAVTDVQPASSSRTVDAVAGLEAIFDDGISVAIWRRDLPAALRADVAAALAHGTGLHGEIGLRDGRPDPAALAALAALPSLHEDIADLVELFAIATGARRAGLRLECLTHAMCPRFHVDRVALRLLCTYAGAGTEWVDAVDVDRRGLGPAAPGRPAADTGMLRPGARIRQLPAGAVGLFKGDLWPGNAGRGAVHRSPPAGPDARRLLLSIDLVR